MRSQCPLNYECGTILCLERIRINHGMAITTWRLSRAQCRFRTTVQRDSTVPQCYATTYYLKRLLSCTVLQMFTRFRATFLCCHFQIHGKHQRNLASKTVADEFETKRIRSERRKNKKDMKDWIKGSGYDRPTWINQHSPDSYKVFTGQKRTLFNEALHTEFPRIGNYIPNFRPPPKSSTTQNVIPTIPPNILKCCQILELSPYSLSPSSVKSYVSHTNVFS